MLSENEREMGKGRARDTQTHKKYRGGRKIHRLKEREVGTEGERKVMRERERLGGQRKRDTEKEGGGEEGRGGRR